MNNQQLIQQALLENNLEEAHTFAGWKERGYTVKKGEKAKFSQVIWKNVKTKEDTEKFYMKKAYFFTKEQVEKSTK